MPSPPKQDLNAFELHVIQGYPLADVAARQQRPVVKVERGLERVKRWRQKQAELQQKLEQQLEDVGDANVNGKLNGVSSTSVSLAVARLQHSWYESMGAWYRSQSPEETFKAATNEKSGQRAEHIKRMRVGDLRFLELARRLVREMVALETTGKVAEDRQPDVDTLTPDERREELHRITSADGVAETTAADVGTDQWHPQSRLPQTYAAS